MQELHLVGVTTDHTGLILTTRRGAKTGKYSVAADDKLLAAVQEAQRLRDGGEEKANEPESSGEGSSSAVPIPVALPPTPPPKPVSSLSPREIQARLRAGGTVAEIAAAAGVDEEWILRFADPIRAEQARVVEQAQGLTFNKARLGVSAEPLATSVVLNLAERGVRLPADVFSSAWTAFNLHGTNWAVVFSYTSRQRRQTAQWELDLRSGELTARNRLASDLGYLEPGRRRRRPEPLELPEAEPQRPGGRRPATRAAAPAKAPSRRALIAASKKAATSSTLATPPPAKRAPAAGKKGAAAGKVAAAGKSLATGRVPFAKKVAPAGKAPPAKKAPATGKVVAARKQPPAAKVTAGKVTAAKKGSGRQSSPRGRRPVKKPADKKPPARGTAPPAATAPTLPERPTHLARPPSPMNPSNRSVTVPGRLVGAPSLRPPLPPSRLRPPEGRSRPRPQPEQVRERETERETEPETAPAPANGNPAFELSASPPERAKSPEAERRPSGGDGAGPEAATGQESGEPGERVRRRRSERRISPRVGEQPAVVILSTPAVRRLESGEEPESSKTPAPPS